MELSDLGYGIRPIDVGGEVEDEEPYEGPVLVIFAVDPGVTTGWSALKVPVGLLPSLGATRTLARCRWLYGQVLRSGGPRPSPGGGSYSSTDSAHVTDIFKVADYVFDTWCRYEEERSVPVDVPILSKKGKHRGTRVEMREVMVPVIDEDVRFVFALEGFDLRESTMDPSLLAPVRVNSIFMDRLWMRQSGALVLFQSASDAKRTVTDDRLKRWGLYSASSGAHSRDATRHASLLLRRFAASSELRRSLWEGTDPLEGWSGGEGE